MMAIERKVSSQDRRSAKQGRRCPVNFQRKSPYPVFIPPPNHQSRPIEELGTGDLARRHVCHVRNNSAGFPQSAPHPGSTKSPRSAEQPAGAVGAAAHAHFKAKMTALGLDEMVPCGLRAASDAAAVAAAAGANRQLVYQNAIPYGPFATGVFFFLIPF